MTNLQLHNDEHNAGRCLTCGCTVRPWELYCRYCVDAEVEEMLKEDVAEGAPDSAKLVEEDE